MDPSILGAYGSRAEAHRRLGMDKEAAVDLSFQAQLKNQRNPITYIDFIHSPKVGKLLVFGVGWGLIGGGVWGIAAPWVTDVTLWWPTMLGATGLLGGLWFTWETIADRAESTELAGMVTKKRTHEVVSYWDTSGWTNYYITVSSTEFEVTEGLYHSVNRGDEVVLTVDARWVKLLGGGVHTRIKGVIAIAHGMSSTAQQLSVLEEEPQDVQRTETST